MRSRIYIEPRLPRGNEDKGVTIQDGGGYSRGLGK